MINDCLEINILTIFPNMFKGPFSESILNKAQEKGLIKINLIDLRDFTLDKHKTVDDYSYGGGPKEESMVNDSFYNEYLDYPHYTRPDEFKGFKVPEILLSGNHKEIEKWRRKQSQLRTLIRRPEIFANKKLSKRELALLKELEKDFEED